MPNAPLDSYTETNAKDKRPKYPQSSRDKKIYWGENMYWEKRNMYREVRITTILGQNLNDIKSNILGLVSTQILVGVEVEVEVDINHFLIYTKSSELRTSLIELIFPILSFTLIE